MAKTKTRTRSRPHTRRTHKSNRHSKHHKSMNRVIYRGVIKSRRLQKMGGGCAVCLSE